MSHALSSQAFFKDRRLLAWSRRRWSNTNSISTTVLVTWYAQPNIDAMVTSGLRGSNRAKLTELQNAGAGARLIACTVDAIGRGTVVRACTEARLSNSECSYRQSLLCARGRSCDNRER